MHFPATNLGSSMDCFDSSEASLSPYALLFKAASLIPISHCFSALLFLSLLFLYNFFEFHLFQDLIHGFRGSPVSLTFNSRSEIYDGVASKCRILHGRYLATPWLSNPHFQTAFLNFFGMPPAVSYRRQLFHASDGGTIALDWLMSSDVLGAAFRMNNASSKDDTTPIVVVIPGLTSDSASAYIKHLAFNTAKHGWNIVISNHRGLGGIAVTSDCFYNAGWTEDAREVIRYLHNEFPQAPLFAVGTSIGANILVKYLGEDGDCTPVAGAAAISSPWDLLIGDRFIKRRFLQKLYDRALTIGLQDISLTILDLLIGKALRRVTIARHPNSTQFQHHFNLAVPAHPVNGTENSKEKSRSIRDFDNYATCLVGKFETVDTYYRRCSSTSFVGNISVPLLCISALDDPVCTREAIPWDECRANKNIVLATPEHGGHLAFFEGITASGLWWVRAVNEFFSVLHSSPLMHTQKKTQDSSLPSALESSIDQGPYVNVVGDGMVAAMGNESTIDDIVEDPSEGQKVLRRDEMASDTEQDEQTAKAKSHRPPNVAQTSNQARGKESLGLTSHFRRCLDQLSGQNRRSIWLLAYIAIVTSWPLVGSALRFIYKKKKLKSVLPAAAPGR
ncbi:embryogenesis-associated protein EMB8 isoform X1 [Malania oleifera]|uniref:embryogenesis-associated protein EMB8 isoform X1 n=1 Tax=Malania oleifera TaxID=397392 RepID=UPI0025AEB421|nr:embryogenesis-associated protein EMB8 isoform X1 [Malania oleifera]